MQPVIMEEGRGDHPANAPGIMGFLCFWRGTLASVGVWWAHALNIGIGGLIPDDLQL